MMMALFTGAVSMSALGLGIYGAEGSTRFELGEQEMKRHLKTKIKMALVGFIEIDPFQARY